MSVNAVSTTPVSGARPDPKASEREQLAHLAQEFEAMFISEMMRGMRESLLSEEDQDSGLGSATMTDTFNGEFGRAMSNAGGLGLARLMMEAMSKQAAGAEATPATGVLPPAAMPLAVATPASVAPRTVGAAKAYVASNAVAAVSPRVAPTPAEATPPTADLKRVEPSGSAEVATTRSAPLQALPGPVTSKFGWRSDPFTGRPKFHAGTDIRLAYGQDVQSVAPGRVKSVGERSGYGLTVVIDHGQGLETRYAHLSSAEVKPGDVVDSGQVVARSGNSGRSTGPHLHLEARRNGRAVEMAALLKSSGLSADSYADDRSIVRSGHED